MNKKVVIMLIAFLINVVSSTFSQIIYKLPHKVSVKLMEILENENDIENVYFIFGHDKHGNYKITLTYLGEDEFDVFYTHHSNRVVYINGNYYTLIFESDERFAFPLSKEEFESNIKTGIWLQRYISREFPIEVIFNRKGEIVND